MKFLGVLLIVFGIGLFIDFRPLEFTDIIAACLIAIGIKL